MKVVWDEPKRLFNLEKHRLDFAQLTPEFFLSSKINAARSERLKALGLLDGLAISVIFTILGSEAISVISMRRASKNERSIL
jgi:uncharacterized DUF497 family protein